MATYCVPLVVRISTTSPLSVLPLARHRLAKDLFLPSPLFAFAALPHSLAATEYSESLGNKHTQMGIH